MTNDGEAIRWVRTLRDYSRKALAELSGVKVERLASIEFGAPPRPTELRKIWVVLSGALPEPVAKETSKTAEPPR